MILAMRIVGAAVEQAAANARTSRLAGADLQVTSATSAYIRAGLAAEIAGRTEIEEASPIYQRPEGAVDRDAAQEALRGSYAGTGTGLMLLGVDPDKVLMPYQLVEGAFFSTPQAHQVLLPKSWADQRKVTPGMELSLATQSQVHRYTVVGLLEERPEDKLAGRATAWMPLATMQAAFETPDVATAILIRLAPGTLPDTAREQLQEDLGALYVVASATGTSGGIDSPMLMIVDAALPFAGLTILLAGAFLVYNAFAITLTERQREIGQLRTLGMTRRQILRQVLLEALLVALLGAAIGLPVGFVLGRGMIRFFVGTVQGLPIPQAQLPLDGMLVALGIGILVSLAVTLNLALRAGRISPLAALHIQARQEDDQHWYMRWGWIVSLAFIALFLVSRNLVGQSMRRTTSLNLLGLWFLPPLILAGAALFAIPTGVRAALWLTRKVAPRIGVSTRLAGDNLSRQSSRTVLTTATLTIGLMLVTGLAGMTLVEKEFFKGNLLTLFEAEFLLVPTSSLTSYEARVSLPSLPPLPPELRAELDRVDRQANVYYLANIHLPGYGSGPALDNGWALTLDLIRDHPAYQPSEGSWEEAERIFDEGLALSIPEIASRRLDLHPGDIVQVDTLEGRLPFRVAFVGGPLPIVTSEVGELYFHSHPFLILVDSRPGGDREALETHLDELAGRYGLAFTADMMDEFGAAINDLFDVVLALFAGLTSITGLVAGLSIINTLIAAVTERQREIGVLRALGMTRRQIRRLFAIEAGLLGLTGAVIGSLCGLAMGSAFAYSINSFAKALGFNRLARVPLPWIVVGVALITGPAMAVVASLYPATRAAQIQPAEAIRGS
jgi:putative ABC transport system permease protein